ncbi:Ig-like domain-containing protein [Actinomycetes bacterium KLBMP 9797]
MRTSRRAVAAAALAALLALVTACSGGGDDDNNGGGSSWNGGGNGGQAEDGSKAVATITGPAADAKDVPAATEIIFTTENATGAPTVEMKDAAGEVVKGALQADGKTWLPEKALDYATAYTATVTATDADGKPATASNTFTTMAKPANQVRVSSFLADGAVVGVGMPLIVRFSRSIPEDYRDDVERRMTVSSVPAQEGVWHWTSPTEIHFRPKVFWKANTKISYKLQTGGLPMGDGWYGRSDVTVDMKIGSSLIMTVDNKTKQMTVTKDGKVIKKIPVSLGAPRTPSSSGTMVVIEKKRKTVFDTMDAADPQDRYRTDIEYAQRITWSGQFIHAAPWSEGVQGRTNVSHGCVNVSMAMGAWLFNQTKLGDPITVKGTGDPLKNGNGWTDWNMSWAEYVKGSALQ